jgi:starch phosphorylase
MATYKRAALLLSQPERLQALLADDDRPIQFIFAGKAHPADDHGKELIRQIVTFSHDAAVRHRFVFVEDYDMALARSLVQGADVWLNTPVRPMEASGTSGMKAVLNGALHCSVLDGWWAECFSPGTGGGPADPGPNGWAISSAEAVADESRRIEIEANSLFELLETQVVPLYPTPGWTERMIENLRTLGPFVSAHRMVRDYVQDLYLPAAARALDLESDGYSGARQLAAYRSRLDDVWHHVHVDEVSSDESAADLGTLREVTATVALGELHPDEVEVQLVCGHVGQSGELESPTTLPMTDTGEVDERHRRFSGMAPLDVAGRMGVTVRVVPRHPLVDTPTEFGRVAWAD